MALATKWTRRIPETLRHYTDRAQTPIDTERPLSPYFRRAVTIRWEAGSGASMTTRKLSFVGVLTALSCLLLPPSVRPAAAQAAAPQTAAPQTAAPAPQTSAPAATPAQKSPLAAAAAAAASRPAAAPAVKTPFLWRIEGPVPSYLYGTIHVPDPRVTNIPPVVDQAFKSSAAVFTEIPMDAALQLGMMSKMLLPGDQSLTEVLGPELYARLSSTIQRSLPKDSPQPMAAAMTAMLGRMKPWAAMLQLTLVEFLPDMLAGNKPLDTMLYDRAKSEGKETGGLETIDEQLAVFEALTMEEQVRLLKVTLDAMDEAQKAGRSAARELIEAYLTGDLDKLAAMSNDSMKGELELQKKFMARALDGRNQVMVARLLEKRGERPDKTCFFAVGTLHYAGEEGIIALLEKKGLKVTRVTAP
jgi:uncharacterized protein